MRTEFTGWRWRRGRSDQCDQSACDNLYNFTSAVGMYRLCETYQCSLARDPFASLLNFRRNIGCRRYQPNKARSLLELTTRWSFSRYFIFSHSASRMKSSLHAARGTVLDIRLCQANQFLRLNSAINMSGFSTSKQESS